jgi:Flp pilus assembly protein TadG
MTMRRCRGNSILEFALSAPLLMLLAAGVLNYGMALRAAVAVSAAARAGAQYGSLSTANAADIAGMRAAALDAAPNLTGLTITPVQACRCSNGSAVSCIGSCPSGPVALYVDVTARGTSPNLFAYSGLPFSGAVSARAVMRAR